MADDLARLTVAFEAQTAKFEAGLSRMDGRLKRFERNQKRSLQQIGRAFRNLGRTVAAGFAISVAKSTADAAIKMQQFERALKVATGSADGAARELEFVGKVADDLGLSFESTAQGYSKLAAAAKGTALEGQNARDIFIGVSEASRVLGLTAEQTGGALTAIEQIISKGKVSAEELRGQLGERLPGAFQIAARSIDVTTAELDNMLKSGQLAAEDLLPALARELHNTFGPEVEGAANDAQAAMNRFESAIFKLKTEIAQGGILDAMSQLAKGATAVAQGIGAAFFNSSPFPFEKEIQDARDKIDDLYHQRDLLRNQAFFSGGGSNQAIARINEEIAAQEKLIATLTRKQEIEFGLGAAPRRTDADQILGRFDATNAELDASFAATEARLIADAEKFAARYATAEEKAAALRAELERLMPLLNDGQIANAEREINEILTSGIEEIEVQVGPRVQEATKKMDEMVTHAGFAASSMQQAFADFLFDPFDHGLERMLKNFLDIIRRMAVNELAQQIFGSLFGFGGGGGIFGGFRAEGGPVSAGSAYVVGERGPEMFVPRVSGSIIPNGAGGSVSVVNHIDMRGADAALIRRLPEFGDRITQQTIAQIKKLQREGRM